MDKQHFDRLVKGVRAMKRYASGFPVRGARVTELPAPEAARASRPRPPAKRNTRD
ncbi:MAG: hypothetical protein ACK5TK_09515 [Betaproteobacteria bacterium]